ncbi:MAG: glycosyltransferase, partial [Micrococcales bacterium]|nr:glycosyltransferase [Micrococcales bacterium]
MKVNRAAQAASRRARALGLRLARQAVWTAVAHDSPVRQRIPAPVLERIAPLAAPLVAQLPRKVRNGIDGAITAPTDWVLFGAGSRRPTPPSEPVRVWVAPTNSAGQGRLWAQALERHVEGVGARNMGVVREIRFPADQEVAPEIYRDPRWQKEQERYVLEGYTHVLIEAERPIFGTRHGRTCEFELPRLRRAGITVGLISHGSDLRIPSQHLTRHPYSPFDDPSDELTGKLEVGARRNARILREAEGPVFVSTPDLLDYTPNARWCPTVVDPDGWSPEYPLLRRAVPRVVHIPSNGRLKGTEYVDAALRPLHDAGLIEYRSLRALTHEEVRAEYEEADVVVDQLVLGLYGVAAIEAMAAGRYVVAYLGDVVRERVRQASGLQVPIAEADPDTLADVIATVLADREAARAFAAGGPAYVRRVHDGRFSARVLTALTGGELRQLDDPLETASPADP